MLRVLTFLILFVQINILAAQISYLPLNNFLYYDYEIKAFKTDNFHTSIKPYAFDEITDSVTFFEEFSLPFQYSQFKSNSLNASIIPVLSAIGSYHADGKSFLYEINAGFSFHSEFKDYLSFHTDLLYVNSELPGYVDQKTDSFNVIPHFSSERNSFIEYTGYISYKPAGFISFQTGKGKNFLGDGYRSLFLSDNSASYPFFMGIVNIWRIKYLYMIAGLKDIDTDRPDEGFQKKYTALHYLSLNLTKRLTINMFEAVIASPVDSLGANRGFDLNYLNPVIFFRPVEFSLGSPDNVIMGVGLSYKIAKSGMFYSQFILDEFIWSNVKARNGWWGNKQGFQSGLKSYRMFFIDDLYAQAEINIVRPYTYSHENSIRNWGSYHQPLAHPLGANLMEGIGIISYRYKKFRITAKFVYSEYGSDIDSLSYGNNIYRPYSERVREFDNYIGQGEKNSLLYSELKFSYNFISIYSLEAGLIFTQKQAVVTEKNLFIYFGIKTLLFNNYFDF